MSYFTEHKPTQVADKKAILDPIPFALEQSPNGVEDPADPDFLPFILKDEEGHIIGGHYVTEDAYTNLLIAMHDGIENVYSFLDICSLSKSDVEKGNILIKRKGNVHLIQVPLGLSFHDGKDTGWRIIERMETCSLLQKGAMALSWLLHRVQKKENTSEKLAFVRTRYNKYASNGYFEVSISTTPVNHADAFMYTSKDAGTNEKGGEVVEQSNAEGDTGW